MLLLDSVLFQEWQLPENVKGLLSGKQMLAVKKQIGGARVIDAMGPDPADVEWSARFQGGGDAAAWADQIAVMRDAGQAVVLVCDAIVLNVVVAEFHFEYERPWQASYRIKLIVIPDVSDDDSASLDDQVGSDMDNANTVSTSAPNTADIGTNTSLEFSGP
jgi:hypothetical protein